MRSVGLVLIGLALLISVVPQFTNCEVQGHSVVLPSGATLPMRCHWAARAELATGVPLLMIGALLAGGRRRDWLLPLSMLTVALGVLTILLPGPLIGVCGNPDMTCNLIMRPTLTLAGVLVIGAGGAGLLLLRLPPFSA